MELNELLKLVDKGKPVLLVDRGGKRVRVRCIECGDLCVAKLKRQKKIGMVCDSCMEGLVADAMQKYRDLVVSGVPKSHLYVEYRTDLLRYLDKRWHDPIREALNAEKLPPRPTVTPIQISTAGTAKPQDTAQ